MQSHNWAMGPWRRRVTTAPRIRGAERPRALEGTDASEKRPSGSRNTRELDGPIAILPGSVVPQRWHKLSR